MRLILETKQLWALNEFLFNASSAFASFLQGLSLTVRTGLLFLAEDLLPSVRLWEYEDGIRLKHPPDGTTSPSLLIFVGAAAIHCAPSAGVRRGPEKFFVSPFMSLLK